MEKIVVFDFDKTLTNNDTTFPFFLYCCKFNILRYFFVIPFVFIKILSKLNFITVKQEKEIGLKFFCPSNVLFKNAAVKFAEKIALNSLYYDYLLKYKRAQNVKIIIASAAFEDILKSIFPNLLIIGTKINSAKGGKIIGIKQHPFGKEKANLLKHKFNKIDFFYTDSMNDIYTTYLALKTFWVAKGKIISQS